MLAPVLKFETLSFVSGRNSWNPVRTGDYGTDTAAGRRYADELLNFIRVKDCALAYGRVARAIVEGGVFEAVEIGFCSRIGIHLCVAPPVAAAAEQLSAG